MNSNCRASSRRLRFGGVPVSPLRSRCGLRESGSARPGRVHRSDPGGGSGTSPWFLQHFIGLRLHHFHHHSHQRPQRAVLVGVAFHFVGVLLQKAFVNGWCPLSWPAKVIVVNHVKVIPRGFGRG